MGLRSSASAGPRIFRFPLPGRVPVARARSSPTTTVAGHSPPEDDKTLPIDTSRGSSVSARNAPRLSLKAQLRDNPVLAQDQRRSRATQRVRGQHSPPKKRTGQPHEAGRFSSVYCRVAQAGFNPPVPRDFSPQTDPLKGDFSEA